MLRAPTICVLVVAAASAHAETPALVATGFDHNVHDRMIITTGKTSLSCERCHPIRGGALVGRPGHAACFGACHGAPPLAARTQPIAIDADRMKICTSCHAEATLRAPPATRKPTVGYPPYQLLGADHALAFGHKAHQTTACAQCHADPETARRGAPHGRCATCHDGGTGKGFAMAGCKSCHTPAGGKPEPVAMLVTGETQLAVTGAFSHARHAARGVTGKQCATCHPGISDTNDRQLPRVVAKSCAARGCHDGGAAFPITAACTKCHKQAPVERFRVERPSARFSHTAHLVHLKGVLVCAGCHPTSKSGDVQVAGHAPCASCHADDFGNRTPKICGACHTATEPWRALIPDQLPPDRSEFGATLDHGQHKAECTTCHSLNTARVQLRPPRGHRACATAGCHAASAGPAPQMAACESCHQRGLADTRSAARLAAPWSARATFNHAKHELGEAGPIACTTCHVDLSSPHVLGLAAPTKATCAPCHDGKTSFKLTGTTCTRCHLGARR